MANGRSQRSFTSFTRSAFRLEGLQHYTDLGEHEAFERFRAGKDPDVDLALRWNAETSMLKTLGAP